MIGIVLPLALFLAGKPSTPNPHLVGHIDAPGIPESSGVVESRTYPGVLWTHNDSGNPPNIFAIDRSGKLLARYFVDRDNHDWEDIAIDDAGHLYIGEIGNNGAHKTELFVYRVAEPDPGKPTRDKLRVDRTWALRFAGEPFDCESLFVWNDNGYVIAKFFAGQKASVWRFSLAAGERPQTLQHVCDLPVRLPVTGADLSADGRRLAIVTAVGPWVFEVNGEVGSAGTAPCHAIDCVDPAAEAVCFADGGVLTTSERRNIYFFKAEEFQPPASQPASR